jgi:methionyl-tRNA formyltransferase
MKIIFMGTPEFAVPSLKLLYFAEAVEVLAVLTQPDRPKGRGKKLQPSPVKQFALEHDIPVYQPARLRKDQETLNFLKSSGADIFVTVAFGQILSKEVLDIPPYGTVNLHASLLPKYRGANPIQWAIINGDTSTGITTMLTEEGVDCGDMILKQEIPISLETDTIQLSKEMSEIGARVLLESLLGLYEGAITPVKQDHEQATKAPKLTKEKGNINWEETTYNIHNLIRGSKPWPGSYTSFNDSTLKVSTSSIPVSSEKEPGEEPGMIKEISKHAIRVTTGDAYIDIVMIQPPNKAVMKAVDWARGARVQPGDKFNFKQES